MLFIIHSIRFILEDTSQVQTMFFFQSTTSKMESMRDAERRLMEFAKHFGGRSPDQYQMTLFDTEIPSHVVPLKCCKEKTLIMHGVHIQSRRRVKSSSKESAIDAAVTPPLVLLHGYANGSLYFYRNLLGLSRYFDQIYSLDLLGWGLSSRPKFCLKDDSAETAEAFFVESLEAWRKEVGVEKMILAGHSMGGHMGVAYCEKYPQHVERLVLLSPAGVPEDDTPEQERNASTVFSGVSRLVPKLFDFGTTPCSVLRTVPQGTGYGWVQNYIQGRLPAISNPEEQTALGDYLYHNATLPGSAEYALNKILTVFAMGKRPTVRRIPLLKVPHVTFLYGSRDWMDSSGGLSVERACYRIPKSPSVEVYQIPNAGHLLMLENWSAFNAGLVMGGLGLQTLDRSSYEISLSMPKKLFAGTPTLSPATMISNNNKENDGYETYHNYQDSMRTQGIRVQA